VPINKWKREIEEVIFRLTNIFSITTYKLTHIAIINEYVTLEIKEKDDLSSSMLHKLSTESGALLGLQSRGRESSKKTSAYPFSVERCHMAIFSRRGYSVSQTALVELLLACAWETWVSWARKSSAMDTSWGLCRSRNSKKKFV